MTDLRCHYWKTWSNNLGTLGGLDGHVCWNSIRRLPFIFCRPKKNQLLFPFPFAANKWKFSVSVFRLQKTNGSCLIPLVPFLSCGNMETLTWRHRHGEIDMKTWRHRHGNMKKWKLGDMKKWTWRHKRKTEPQAIFLNPFTVCSSCKQKFVVCQFVYDKTNRTYRYPFTNGLNDLNGLSHL